MMEAFRNAFVNFRGAKPSLLVLYEHTDSTNERAKRFDGRADGGIITKLDGADNAALFIADTQSRGRGRLGRSFESPVGKGLYMSLRLKVDFPLCEALSVTPFAAVAAARAIERLTGAEVKIKWVNDLYIGEKKLAGILTESVPCASEDGSCTLVIGIGINIGDGALSPEISRIATSLEEQGFACEREALACEIVQEILTGLCERDSTDTVNEYRRRSMLTDRQVTVLGSGEPYVARVLGITDSYGLEVELPSAERRTLIGGEVSCRPI